MPGRRSIPGRQGGGGNPAHVPAGRGLGRIMRSSLAGSRSCRCSGDEGRRRETRSSPQFAGAPGARRSDQPAER
ncbi:hypothetical protein AC630_03395 [Bradyrhizobium sp. AS23.2]|nr:hypothetical protein AC630_03395 [Bradyrhizobium sp. AS23.2]